MRKFLLAMFVVIFSISSSLALAQTDIPEDTEEPISELTPEEEAELFPILPEQQAIPNTTSCFDDYRFGSVQTDVSPSVLSTVPGVPITFSGKIKNDNPYPIVDGSVYIKIFKKQATHSNEDLNTKQNGPELVDQFFAKENVSIKSKGSEPILFAWQIPRNAPTGDYQAATYFVTAKRFNLSGLSFTDDVTGNKVDFSIRSDVTNPPVFFNKNTVTLNQKPHKFAIFPLHFSKEESVTAEAEIVNPSKTDKTIQLTWKLYKWDGLREENKKDEKTETITLKGSETKKVSYTVNKDTGSVAYLVAEAKDKESKSILNIRFVREGIEEIRLNFPSITSYPLTQGQENSLFSCVHSTSSPIVKDNTLTLTLKTLSGETIHKYTYQGDISGEMMGVKEAFTPKQTVKNFTLTATLKNQGNTIEEVTQTYLCDKLGDNCPKETTSSSQPSDFLDFGEKDMWLKLVLFLAGSTLLFFIIRRMVMKKSTMSFLFFFSLLVAGFLFVGTNIKVAEAEWRDEPVNKMINGDLFYRNRYYNKISKKTSIFYGGWSLGLRDPNITIHYMAKATDVMGNILANNADVSEGSQIKFQFKPYDNTDISWNGTGYSADTPYGRWKEKAKAPTKILGWSGGRIDREKNTCDLDDFTNKDPVYNLFDVYIPLSVNPPQKSFGNYTGLNCGEMDSNDEVVCTVTANTGMVNANLKFEDTYAKFYYRYYDPRTEYAGESVIAGCFGNNVPMNPNPPIDALYPPQITGPNVLQVGTNGSFIVFSDNLQDNYNVRYGFDWNNDKKIDQWTGYTASPVTVDHAWLAASIKMTVKMQEKYVKFGVMAQDEKGDFSRFTWLNIKIKKNHVPDSQKDITTVYPEPSPVPNDFKVIIPAQTINFAFNAVQTNGVPSAPLVKTTSIEPGTVNGSNLFLAASTDPEGDPVRYEFNWNNDGITFVPVPADGSYVASCPSPLTYDNMNPCAVSSSYSWLTPLDKTFQVRARDNNNGVSPSTSHTIKIVGIPLVDLKVNGSDGPINLTKGQMRNFSWTTTDATFCTASSSDVWSGSKAIPSGSESLAANNTSNNVLTCTGPGGTSSDSVQVNVTCPYNEGPWGECQCPAEDKERTITETNCNQHIEKTDCTSSEKNACRDFNFREVAP